MQGIRTITPHAWVVCAVIALAAPKAPAQWQYFYFDEPRSLKADPTRIAVQTTGNGVAATDPTLDQYTLTAWPIHGWSLATPIGGIAAIDLEQQVAAVAEAVMFASPVFLDEFGGPLIVTPDLLVGFHDGVAEQAAERILDYAGAGTIAERRFGDMAGTYRLESGLRNGFDVLRVANVLAQLPEVKFAEPDMVFTGRGSLVPSDPLFPDAWGLQNTGQFGGTPGMDMAAVDAWDLTVGDASVIVAVLDTGVEQTHPDINQFTPGTDTTSDASTDGNPVNGFDDHGTAVAGCVSGVIENDLGAVGIAPGCRVASARTFIAINSAGQWTSQSSWTVASLSWAESVGARVTNNSNCYAFESPAIDSKYADTRANGMVHFASSCNDGTSELGYPSLISTVNAVGALDEFGQRATFSNVGEGLAFAAPGVNIVTTDRTGIEGYSPTDFAFVQGTSFASPYAAGAAALFLSLHPEADADTVELALTESAVDVHTPGYDIATGWGFVNALRALEWQPSCVAPEPIALEADSRTLNRYLTFVPPRQAGPSALRVTAVDLPPPYDAFDGASWWIGVPDLVSGNATPPTLFQLSTLQCSPAYLDWGSIDVLYVYGTQILPLGTYTVETLLEDCGGSSSAYPSYFSTPFGVRSSTAWGDVAEPYALETPAGQPDFRDIAAIVEAFLETADAPALPYADLDPSLPNLTIDFSDIAKCVGAFVGHQYDLGDPVLCP